MADNERTAQMDTVLDRLAAVAGRPWDRAEEPEPRGPSLLSRFRERRIPVFVGIGVVVAAGLATAVLGLSGAPPREPPPDLVAAVVTEPSTASIVVDVVGKVHEPGLRTLPEGARVDDALRACGGALPDADLSTLNLARRLVDGEQIAVGVPASEALPSQPGGKVNLNTASLPQLDTLPGVGTVTAQRILDWRTAHGRFSRVEQLREIEGIGPTRFDKLREQVTIR
ncbi:ComEA family DNA-binding protein [Actinokineospora enzanensis]|uniref:ComEA family DNA-binding protein n=1 Tax=Actinokineospora enzanensis TaxID=155975 RepID=UPI00036933B8|nr:ComEA family DNA-binding protein [Actinokineospora enzanensis]